MGFHETIAPDEALRFERYALELREIQRTRGEQRGNVARVLHVKQHVGAVGELRVHAAPTARVGVFSEQRTWPVYVRWSNGGGMTRSDSVPDVRGFAVKLVGVPGRKIIKGLEDAQTQDFLFINDPSVPFRTPDEFLMFVRAAKDGPGKLLPRLVSSFGVRRSLSIMRRLLKSPKVRSFATHAFHTATPISFGETAAKLALFPLQNSIPQGKTTADGLRSESVLGRKASPEPTAVIGF